MVIDVLPSFIINHIGLAQNQNWQSTKDMDMFLSVGGVQDQGIWNKLEMRHSIPDLVIPNSSSPSRSKSLTGTRRKSTTSSKNIKTYLKRGSSLDTSTTVQYNAKTQHTWDFLSHIYIYIYIYRTNINFTIVIYIFVYRKFIKSNRRHNVAFTKENSINKHDEDEWQCTNR